MKFQDKYTTQQFIDLNDIMISIDGLNKDTTIKESDKFIISSDAFALGEMIQLLSDRLELLNNRMVK